MTPQERYKLIQEDKIVYRQKSNGVLAIQDGIVLGGIIFIRNVYESSGIGVPMSLPLFLIQETAPSSEIESESTLFFGPPEYLSLVGVV